MKQDVRVSGPLRLLKGVAGFLILIASEGQSSSRSEGERDYLSCACRDLTSRHGSLVWVEMPGCDGYCDKASPRVGRRVSSRVMSSRRRPLGPSG